MSSSTLRLLTSVYLFFFRDLFAPSLWPHSYSNLFTISNKCSKWTNFIHIASLWWQLLYFTRYSFLLTHICLARNVPSISTTNMCSMASTFGRAFCFQFGFWSSLINNLNFETLKVGCATKLDGNFRVYMSRCDLYKISQGPTYLAMKHGVGPLGILNPKMFNHTCCPTSNSTCFHVLLTCFSYRFWAYSKNFFGSCVFFFTPLDHLHTFLKVIFMSHGNG